MRGRRSRPYLVPDEAHRPFQAWRHEVGTPATADALVHEEADERFELTLEASRSGALAILTSGSRDTTEVWLLDLAEPLADARLVEPREPGIEYRVDHAQTGELYVVTNAGAEEFTLARTALASPGRANWRPVNSMAIAPARGDTRLVRCDVLVEHPVLTVRRDGTPLLVITDHQGGNVHEISPGLRAGCRAPRSACSGLSST